MRLIDADNIRLNLWVPSKNNETVKAFENSVIDALDRQPTVEAIPIEWIKKQIEEWKNWGPEGLSDDEWEYGTCLETLLENWVKENEIN